MTLANMREQIVRHRTLLVAALVFTTAGATAFAECDNVPRGYRVMAYDGQTHQYTIYRNGTYDGKYLVKKIVVVCDLYQRGKNPPVRGPTECDLEVGEFYPVGPNTLSRDKGPAFVNESADRLTVTVFERRHDIGDVYQKFNVVSIEMLADNNKGC